jgi:hypothetical protein
MEAYLRSLEVRLSRAEREVRGLRALGLAAIVVGVLLIVARAGATQGQGTIVKAPFRVVDTAAKAIIEVDADPGEGRRLRLLGTNGELLAHVGDSGEGGEITAYGGSGGASISLLGGSKEALFSITGKPGRKADVILGATAAKGGRLSIADQSGKALLKKQ